MPTVNLTIPRLYPAQQHVKNKANRNNVLCWGRRGGKTTFTEHEIVETVLGKGASGGGKLGWFWPSYKVAQPFWDHYVELFKPVTEDKDETDHYLKLKTGGILECWSFEMAKVARSRDYDKAIIEEVTSVPKIRERFEKEIRPTLIDRVGRSFFVSTPDGDDGFKELYDLGDDAGGTKPKIDPDWSSFHLPTWGNPYLPKSERDRVYKLAVIEQDPVARQEYGAEFVQTADAFVKATWVDALMLNADHWQPLDPRTSITVGIDVGAKNDLFSITGWGRDHVSRKYKPMFAKLFYPEDLTGPNGGVSFDKPKQFIRDMARGYQILGFAYDPYQCWALADDLYNEGVGIFTEFPQGAKRVLSDSYLYGLIRDRQIEMSLHDEGHRELAQHFKNANAKIEGEDKRRLVKRADTLKIDSAVSSSMSLWHLQEFGV